LTAWAVESLELHFGAVASPRRPCVDPASPTVKRIFHPNVISRKLVERTLWILASLSIILIALSCAVYVVRSGWLSVGQTTVRLADVRHESGFAYIAPTYHPELSERWAPSEGIVLENGVPLSGTAGAEHAAIRKSGKGRTSFWQGDVYFSSSDNSSPVLNGRIYAIRYSRYVTDPQAYAVYIAALAFLAVTGCLAWRFPWAWERIRCAANASAVPLLRFLLGLSFFSLAISAATILNRDGVLSLGWKNQKIAAVRHEAGFAYIAPTHHPELSVEKATSSGVVLEGGVPLPGSGDAAHDEIRDLGRGRYSFSSETVHFSATDNSSPLSNGRSYEIRYLRILPETLATAAFECAVLLFFAAGYIAYRNDEIRKALRGFITFTFGPQFFCLLLVTSLSLALAFAAFANRRGWASLGQRTDALLHLHPESGFAVSAPTYHPELSAELKPSQGIVLENGAAFPRALNASHGEIKKLGGGRYSFWGGVVYFSASDNSDPLTNGRAYAIRYPRSIGPFGACFLYAVALLLSASSVWYALKIPPLLRWIDRIMCNAIAPPYFLLITLSGLTLGLSYAAYMNRHGMFSLGWKTVSLHAFRTEGGFAYSAPTNNSDLGPTTDPSTMVMLENGVPLPGPAESVHDEIRQLGRGRYSFWGDNIYFSASDNTDPRVNGRSYQAHYPTMVSRPARLALYALTAILLGAAHRYGRVSNEIKAALAAIGSILRGPIFRLLPILSFVFLLLSCIAYLNKMGALSFGWRSAKLTSIQHDAGFAYVAATGHPELGYQYLPSRGRLLQNGVPLPAPAGVRIEDIRQFGRGRYLFLGDALYFSAPDNSAPVANGRSYEIRYPVVWNPAVPFLLLTVTVILIGATAWGASGSIAHRERLRSLYRFLEHPPFYVPASIVLLLFLIPRLPFFLHFPIVDIEQDSGSYLTLVNLLRGHYWLYFDVRTPGYPLMVWPFTYLPDPWLVIVYSQNFLSLLSSTLLVYGVFRLRPALALPASMAMAAFVAGSQVVMYDTAILSESLYTSTIIFTVAFLILAFARAKPAYFILSSSTMAYSIMVRPAGMYFIVIYALVLAYLLWNRYRRRLLLAYLIPFPAILLLLCSYNYYTLRSFLISPFGEANLAGATILYWEPDASLPEDVRQGVNDLPNAYAKAGITATDFATLRDSWDPEKLIDVFNRQYNRLVWGAGYGSGKRFGHKGYLYYRKYIRQLSLAAIRSHPLIYLKYVWTNFSIYFDNITYHYEFYEQLSNRVRDEFIDKSTAYTIVPTENVHVEPSLPPAIQIIGSGKEAVIGFVPTFLSRLHVAWERIHWNSFLCLFWVWLYIPIFLLSTFRLLHSKGRDLGAFLLVTLSLIVLGGGLVVALVEIAMNRYSYPTQFIFYLLVAMLPILLRTKERANGHASEPSGPGDGEMQTTGVRHNSHD
jgi:hypothetical protein